MVPIPATGALWQSVMNDERTSKMKAATKKREMTPSGRRRGRIVRAGAAVAAGLVAAGALAACGGSSEKVSVSDPWVRVTPGSKDMTAAYMVIESEQADRLVAASVPSDVAETVELHETVDGGHSMDDMGSDSMDEMDDQMEMMGMRQVKSIALPAGREVKLEPGGYHIMLIGLKNPIEPDDSYMITLTFEKAGKIEAEAVGRES